jgi:hypothetical protein
MKKNSWAVTFENTDFPNPGWILRDGYIPKRHEIQSNPVKG